MSMAIFSPLFFKFFGGQLFIQDNDLLDIDW